MNFASDNVGPAAPEVMAAVTKAMAERALPYGDDPWTARAEALIREVFEAPNAEVQLVSAGSAANALALSSLARPWDAIFCHETAHIEMDEAGAPEFYTGGAKLRRVAGAAGKITPESLQHALDEVPVGNVHSVSRGPLSLTQLTEWGTAYSVEEIAALTEIAKAAGLPVHLDGARLANALAASNASPAEMTWKAGVDALSFGGTKNGCIAVEAIVFFNPDQAQEVAIRRKRAGHLLSKHRFLGAQMVGYLEDGLWLELARRANAAMAHLAAEIAALPEAEIEHPPAANMLFFRLPRRLHRHALAQGAQYGVWAPLDGPDDEMLRARVVCDWACEREEIDRLVALWRG